MKRITSLLAAIGLTLAFGVAGAVEYVTPQPLTEAVKTPIQSCGKMQGWKMDYITWGADLVTLFGNGSAKGTAPGSIFANDGLNIELAREDDLTKQVAAFLKCETPFLRGTTVMAAMAAGFGNTNPGVSLVPVVQLSRSDGADALVVKKDVASVEDIKTVALQAYGPHVDFLVKIFRDGGVDISKLKIKWTKDLVGLEGSTPGAAFREDDEVDAAFVISPDATALTAGAESGGDDAVQGARTLLTTDTADNIIMDSIFVRSDFYDSNKAEIAKFQHAFYVAVEQLSDLMKDRKSPAYKDAIKKLVVLLLDSDGPQSVADTEGMYDGANIVGWRGNVSFFADPNEPRSFKVVWNEAQEALLALGLVKKQSPVPVAEWDYDALKGGLKDTDGVSVPKVIVARAKREVARRQQAGDREQGQIFQPFQVHFGVNQTSFPPEQYAPDFDRAIDAMSTYGGALVTVEGHVDPYLYLNLKKKGATERELRETVQSTRNTSLSRADALKAELLRYAKGKGVTLNGERIETVGHGFKYPVTGMCGTDPCMPKSRSEQLDNMRAEIRIVNVEAEMLLPE